MQDCHIDIPRHQIYPSTKAFPAVFDRKISILAKIGTFRKLTSMLEKQQNVMLLEFEVSKYSISSGIIFSPDYTPFDTLWAYRMYC